MKSIPLLLRYGSFVVALLGIFLMSGVMRTLHGQTTSAIPPPPVAPAGKPFPHTVAGTGIIEALSENVAIGMPEPGLVMEVFVKVDQPVKKDAALLRLDDRHLSALLPGLDADIAVANANVAVANATRDKAVDALSRLEAVKDPRAVSQDDLRSRRSDAAVAEAQCLAAQSQVKAAQAKLDQTNTLIKRLTVLAPRDGTILQVNIRAGEYAALGARNPPLVLGDLARLQVRADIDEQNAQRIKPGQKAVAYVKGDTKRQLDLQFSRIEPFIIPKASLTGASTERVDTRVLQVIFTLPQPDKVSLFIGQQVDVFIEEILEEQK